MSIILQHREPALPEEVVDAVASWQQDGVPVQMHPGDLGWNSSFGAEALTDQVRVWGRDGEPAGQCSGAAL